MSQSDLMQTNWATGSLWVLWIICKHFPCQCGTAYSVAAIDSDFDCGSPGLQHYVQGLSPDSWGQCGQCEVWWRQQQPHVIAAPTVQHLFGRCCVMAWGGFVVKGGNLNAERYPGGFRLHISTAGDHTLSSNVPTEQFYQGLPPVLRSGEDWMTWQQLTDLTWLASNLKLIISKSIIRQTNALHKKNKARLIKKKKKWVHTELATAEQLWDEEEQSHSGR